MIIEAYNFLFMEGDPGDKMYIIRKGKVRIMKREGSHMNTLAELGPGSILGEMALLDKQPRSATAKTLETTEVVEINQTMLENTYQNLPTWLTSIIRMVVQRLRETTARKYLDDISNAVPGILFLVQSSVAQGHESIPFNDVCDRIRALYGQASGDTRKIVEAFQKLGLWELTKLENNPELIKVLRPNLLNLCYAYLLDRASPRPNNLYDISDLECSHLEAWCKQAQAEAKIVNSLSLVPYSKLPDDNLVWQNLSLARHVELLPHLAEGQTLTKEHQIAAELTTIEDLVTLHQCIPSLTHFKP